jgi:hypothetical protein
MTFPSVEPTDGVAFAGDCGNSDQALMYDPSRKRLQGSPPICLRRPTACACLVDHRDEWKSHSPASRKRRQSHQWRTVGKSAGDVRAAAFSVAAEGFLGLAP